MSGHYATLLRGTVEAMLPEHDVYITDWADARNVPLAAGRFDFDDFVDYVIDFIRFIGPNTHVMAVCQPAVPALVATALMATRNEDCQPASLVLMGGPIDTRRNPTKVNDLAAAKSIAWFESNVILTVPFPHAGFMRPVYPGFMQLTGLHDDEPRAPHERPRRSLQQPRQGRLRQRQAAPERSTRNISRSWI